VKALEYVLIAAVVIAVSFGSRLLLHQLGVPGWLY